MENDILDVDIDELSEKELLEYKAKLEEYIEHLESSDADEETEEKLAEAEDKLYYIEMISKD